MDWTVYDARSGRPVHRLTTSGTAERDSGVPQGDIALMEDAFADAAGRLAADPGFRAAVARGGPAASAGLVDAAPNDVRLPAEAARAAGPLSLQPPSPSPDPAGRAGRAQVRVGDGRESGIGLVIGTADGQSLLLTLAAGAAATLPVSPAAGVTLAGTVEARDPASGLALVRVPARLTGLAVRTGPARVGEPVTALTRGGEAETPGIVGSLREDPRSGTLLIQADLEGVQAGAGEPLLDRDGLLLGIAAPGRDRTARGVPGLVPYLPVAGALRRMEVTVFAADPLPRTAKAPPGATPLRRHTAPAYPDDES
ncbi:trypsin-like peptidase domain-containing protein [Azospirillum thermophilum]|uniref:Serine protease n=1 Tax=Azospirillum thermophilum TaxID=2202148 RepID=A0A2S2CNR0_9PROT|nr:trypsin-like peptidase domain-containing protein [Azospirillum thermophilum]AWK86098.1 hypothetical protein DEW08_07405 [Azospirillum thermophilum]